MDTSNVQGRWLTHHVLPNTEDKKAMLHQSYTHQVEQLNKKYSAKLTHDQIQKLQLAHHVPDDSMAGSVAPFQKRNPYGIQFRTPTPALQARQMISRPLPTPGQAFRPSSGGLMRQM